MVAESSWRASAYMPLRKIRRVWDMEDWLTGKDAAKWSESLSALSSWEFGLIVERRESTYHSNTLRPLFMRLKKRANSLIILCACTAVWRAKILV